MDKSQSKAPCFLCGKDAFTWGFINSHGSNATFDTAGNGLLGKILVPARDKTRARRCDNCGNILLFDANFVGKN